MGNLEEKSRKNLKNKNLQKIILSTIATAGILSVGLLAPNVLSSFKKMGIIPKKRQKEVIKRSKDLLLKKGLLLINNGYFELSEKGKRLIKILEENRILLNHNKKWDKKWRVLIFDIPEYRRSLRAKIRTTLNNIGFHRLQDSVWIYPYDCEDLIALLKIDFKVGKDLIYMIVEEVENDNLIKKVFGLV